MDGFLVFKDYDTDAKMLVNVQAIAAVDAPGDDSTGTILTLIGEETPYIHVATGVQEIHDFLDDQGLILHDFTK